MHVRLRPRVGLPAGGGGGIGSGGCVAVVKAVVAVAVRRRRYCSARVIASEGRVCDCAIDKTCELWEKNAHEKTSERRR